MCMLQNYKVNIESAQDALGADSPEDEGSQGLGQQVVRTISSLQRFAKSLTR